MRVRLRGINTVRRYRKDGSFALYRYHRATGRILVGEPGTPQFLESLAAAEKAARDRSLGTLSDLISKFENAPEFADFAESTRKEYRRKLRAIDRKWGSCPIAGLCDKAFRRDVLEWRDVIAKSARREADNLVSALARVLAHAAGRALLESNVLDKVERVYHSDRSDKIWLPDHVVAFTRVAPSELEAALMLAMHTGQRQGDLLRLPWSAYDGTRISLKQGKTGRAVSVRCTTALRLMLEGMEKRGPLILTTPGGRAWTKRYFNQLWHEAYLASGIIAGLHFHDLRGTAVTMLAEAGATVPEIAAVTGHSLTDVTRILEVYLARTRTLADAAILKLDRRQNRLQKHR